MEDMSNEQLIAELEHVAFCDYTIQKDLLDRAIAVLSQPVQAQEPVAKDAEYATTWKWVLQSIEKNPDHAVLITTTPLGLNFLHGNPVTELETEIERLEHALSAAWCGSLEKWWAQASDDEKKRAYGESIAADHWKAKRIRELEDDGDSISDQLQGILASGTKCPLCAKTGVHEHTPLEIIIYRNGMKYGRRNAHPPSHVASEPALQVAPFSNCKFTYCDLPGQCINEGKCHHPKSVHVAGDKPEPTAPALPASACELTDEQIDLLIWQNDRDVHHDLTFERYKDGIDIQVLKFSALKVIRAVIAADRALRNGAQL